MTFPFIGVSPDSSVWKDLEKCRHRALHCLQIGFEQLHIYGDDTAPVKTTASGLKELLCVERCGALDPWVQRIKRDCIESFFGRQNEMTSVIDVQADPRIAHDIEVVFTEIGSRHLRY